MAGRGAEPASITRPTRPPAGDGTATVLDPVLSTLIRDAVAALCAVAAGTTATIVEPEQP